MGRVRSGWQRRLGVSLYLFMTVWNSDFLSSVWVTVLLLLGNRLVSWKVTDNTFNPFLFLVVPGSMRDLSSLTRG